MMVDERGLGLRVDLNAGVDTASDRFSMSEREQESWDECVSRCFSMDTPIATRNMMSAGLRNCEVVSDYIIMLKMDIRLTDKLWNAVPSTKAEGSWDLKVNMTAMPTIVYTMALSVRIRATALARLSTLALPCPYRPMSRMTLTILYAMASVTNPLKTTVVMKKTCRNMAVMTFNWGCTQKSSASTPNAKRDL